MSDPSEGLAAVLAAATAPMVHVDPERQARKGVPEIVYAEGKTPEATLRAVRDLLARVPTGRVLVTRVTAALAEWLTTRLGEDGAIVERPDSGPRTLLARRPSATRPVETGGVVGLLTAGASDAATADEAAFVAREMGCRVIRADDVGVAGIHRLEQPLRRLREEGADAVIVAAGMDGALASVVAGLVDVPVIGLPTPHGYGLGGAGVAALLAMLQTCSPGLVVVNVDNGVGAAATASLIANRVAAARTARRLG